MIEGHKRIPKTNLVDSSNIEHVVSHFFCLTLFHICVDTSMSTQHTHKHVYFSFCPSPTVRVSNREPAFREFLRTSPCVCLSDRLYRCQFYVCGDAFANSSQPPRRGHWEYTEFIDKPSRACLCVWLPRFLIVFSLENGKLRFFPTSRSSPLEGVKKSLRLSLVMPHRPFFSYTRGRGSLKK